MSLFLTFEKKTNYYYFQIIGGDKHIKPHIKNGQTLCKTQY